MITEGSSEPEGAAGLAGVAVFAAEAGADGLVGAVLDVDCALEVARMLLDVVKLETEDGTLTAARVVDGTLAVEVDDS